MNSLVTKMIKPVSLRSAVNASRSLSQKPADSSNNDKPAEKTKGDYKSKEYFGYNAYSYFDIEKEMVKHRLPQPSSLPHKEYTWSQIPPSQDKKNKK